MYGERGTKDGLFFLDCPLFSECYTVMDLVELEAEVTPQGKIQSNLMQLLHTASALGWAA